MKTDPTKNKDRFPSDDEFVDAGHNVDIVGENEDNIWQQLEKQEQKISDYFERANENKFEERKQGE